MGMSVGAHELELYTENDGALHRSRGLPIIKNLTLKQAQGKYSHVGAVKAFMYLADDGAKKYAKEHGDRKTPWNILFPVADRKQVAEAFAKEFETEYKLGNYNEYIPKKYQDKAPRRRGR